MSRRHKDRDLPGPPTTDSGPSHHAASQMRKGDDSERAYRGVRDVLPLIDAECLGTYSWLGICV